MITICCMNRTAPAAATRPQPRRAGEQAHAQQAHTHPPTYHVTYLLTALLTTPSDIFSNFAQTEMPNSTHLSLVAIPVLSLDVVLPCL